MARAVRTGGKGAQTGNAEGLLTYRIKRATTPHRTGKLEDGGCAVQVCMGLEIDEQIFNALVKKIEILTPTHFVFEFKRASSFHGY